MLLPRGYLSHNQIRHYIDCPQKYRFLYIEEIVPPINDRIVLGSAFHAAVEHFCIQKMNGSEVGLAQLSDIFRQQMVALQNDKEIHWKTPRREAEARGLAFVRFFFEEIAPDIKPIFCEKELAFVLPGTEIELRGIIDLVEEDFCITDFKTTTSKWSEKKAQNTLQMLIYKYLFDSAFGQVCSRLKVEVLCAKSAASIKRQTIHVAPGDEDIPEMLRVVTHVAQMIGKGVFPKNEDQRCSFCEFRSRCLK